MRVTMIILLLCAFGAVDAKRRGGRGKKVVDNVINKNHKYIEGSKTAVPGGEFQRYQPACIQNSFFGDFTFLWKISERKCTVSGSVTGPTGSGQAYVDFKVDGVITAGTPSDPEYPAPDNLNATYNYTTCDFHVPGIQEDFVVIVYRWSKDPTSLSSQDNRTHVDLNTCQGASTSAIRANTLTAVFKNPSYTVASGLTLTQQSGGGFQVEGVAVFDPEGQKPVVTNYKYTTGEPGNCPWTPEACDSYPAVPSGTSTIYFFYGEADTFNDAGDKKVDEFDYAFTMFQTDKETDTWDLVFRDINNMGEQSYSFRRTPGSIGNESPVVLNDRKVNNWNGSSKETKFNKNKRRQNKKNRKAKQAARKAAKRAKF